MWSSPAAALPRGEKIAREITSAGGSTLFVQTDVAREDDMVALVAKTVGAFGALHIAFNNAGTEGQFGLLTTERSSITIRSATLTSVACCSR